MLKINKTIVKKALAELAFDPNEVKFRFAWDSNNPDYLKLRAQELIGEGNLGLAIQYLTMAKLLDGTKTG